MSHILTKSKKKNVPCQNGAQIEVQQKEISLTACHAEYERFQEFHNTMVSRHEEVSKNFQQEIDKKTGEINMLKSKLDLMTIKLRRSEGKPRWKN